MKPLKQDVLLNDLKRKAGLSIFFSLFLALSVFASGAITGYYYDPAVGKIIPKYDNMTPSQVMDYLNQAGYRQVTDSNGNVFFYDSSNNLVKAIYTSTDSSGNKYKSTYSYNPDGTVKSLVYDMYNPTGVKTGSYDINYNAAGQQTGYAYTGYDSTTGNENRYYTQTNNANGQAVATTDTYFDSNGSPTTYSSTYAYDSNGKLKNQTYDIANAGGITTGAYNINYDPATGQQSGYTYSGYDGTTGDKTRDYSQTNNANGQASSTSDTYYDSNGNKTTYDSTYAYDSNGKLQNQTYATVNNDGITTGAYDINYTPTGQQANYTYNGYDATTGVENRVYSQTNNANGQAASTSDTYIDASGNKTTYDSTYAYDSNGKLQNQTYDTVNNAGITTGAYNINYTPTGQQASYTYNGYDATTGAENRVYSQTNNANGQAASTSDTYIDAGGNKTTYDSTYAYDNNGKLQNQTYATVNNAGITTGAYDINYTPTGQQAGYTYNGYDATTGVENRVYSQTNNANGQAASTSDTYIDAGGNKTTYDSTYAYDSNGKLQNQTYATVNNAGVTTGAYNINYNSSGTQAGYTYTGYDANTGTMNRSYTQTNDSNGKAISSTDTYYDANGNVTATYVWP